MVGYLRTGVEDEKAQYDLIRLRLAKRQTFDEQYRALEQLLDSNGARRLSDPLRSRLASYAASLAEELADPDAQARWVVEAARLDPANPEAAGMLLGMVIDRGGDTLRQGTARINVVRANPLDPQARIDLAKTLASEGAYERAAQQFQVVDRWLSISPVVVGDLVFRELLPLATYRPWLIALVASGDNATALQITEVLDEYLGLYHETAGQAADAASLTPLPEKLPTELELIRLAILDGPSDGDAAAASFGRIEADMLLAPDEQTAGRLAMLAAVFGPDLGRAQAMAQTLAEDDPNKPLALGWVAARRGDSELANMHLAPLAQAGQDLMAACGLLLLSGDDAVGRARRYQEIVHAAPGSLAALAAIRQLSRDGRSVAPTRTGQALLDRMTKFSESLWLVDVDQNPWLDARLRIHPARFGHLDPVAAEITLWNTARFPITIGDTAFVRPHAIVQITATANGQALPPAGPIIINLGRWFTLGPGERVTIDTRLDYHQFGELRALNPGYGILFDARLIVNPQLGRTGQYAPAHNGSLSIVRNCIIQGSPPSEATIESWLGDIESVDLHTRYEAIARVALLNRAGLPGLLTAPLENRLRETMTAKLDAWDEKTAAWAILYTRNTEAPESTYGPIVTDWVRQSDSELVWLAYLARQIRDPESPMLRSAIQRQDLAVVATFADSFRVVLREAAIRREQTQREMEEAQRLQQP